MIGRSLIVDPLGIIRAQLDESSAQSAVVEMSLARADRARRRCRSTPSVAATTTATDGRTPRRHYPATRRISPLIDVHVRSQKHGVRRRGGDASEEDPASVRHRFLLIAAIVGVETHGQACRSAARPSPGHRAGSDVHAVVRADVRGDRSRHHRRGQVVPVGARRSGRPAAAIASILMWVAVPVWIGGSMLPFAAVTWSAYLAPMSSD